MVKVLDRKEAENLAESVVSKLIKEKAIVLDEDGILSITKSELITLLAIMSDLTGEWIAKGKLKVSN